MNGLYQIKFLLALDSISFTRFLFRFALFFALLFFYKNQNSLEFLTISFIRLERPDEASIKHEMCQTSIFSGITQWGQHIFEAALNLLPQYIFRKFFTIRYFEK